MYRRDYFMRLTKQFAQLMSKLMGFKEKGETNKVLETIDEAYKTLFGKEKETIQSINEDEFPEMLKQNFNFTDEQLELLARLMEEEENFIENTLLAKTYLRKALNILYYLNREQKLYSFERENLISELRNRLDSKENMS